MVSQQTRFLSYLRFRFTVRVTISLVWSADLSLGFLMISCSWCLSFDLVSEVKVSTRRLHLWRHSFLLRLQLPGARQRLRWKYETETSEILSTDIQSRPQPPRRNTCSYSGYCGGG